MTLSTVAHADRVDDYLKDQMARNRIPGLAVAVVQRGKLLKLKAYGSANLEWGQPVAPDTAFQLASSTKPLTGTALMLLVQDGKLDLDAPIARYLPDAPDAWKAITLRALASHTSGLKDDLGGAKIRTAEDAVNVLKTLPLDFPTCERSAYGISGYIVLQRIIEKVTGLSFAEFMQQRLFRPLHMDSTRFDNGTNDGDIRTSDVVPHRASVYEWEGGRQRVFSFFFPAHAYSAGGAYASAADLASWIVSLDRGRLLTAKSLETMWTPPRLNNGQPANFAVGWAAGTYRGQRTVGHSGGPALSDILRFPDLGLTVIVLCNQESLYPWLAQGVADRYLPATARPAPVPEAADPNPALTARLSGMLNDAAKGTVSPDLFTPGAQQQLLPMVQHFLPLFFRPLDPLTSFRFVSRHEDGGLQTVEYRALYGDKSLLWTFLLTPDGKIQSLEPHVE
jgi:CubicO group peptidase (beta-lactamase class C family)